MRVTTNRITNMPRSLNYSSPAAFSRYRLSLMPIGVCVAVLTACGGSGGDDTSDGGVIANDPPVPVANCSNTPQSAAFRGFLQATDNDNNTNELSYSLDPTIPQVAGPVTTVRGTIQLLDVTTGEFRYTPKVRAPRGADSFEFRVDDPDSFATATETVIVNPAIMPLGDSITEGTLSRNLPPEEQRVGYRRQLFDDLTTNGFAVDFVGGLSSGRAANPPIDDPQHEGHPGFSAADIADGRDTFQGIYRALNKNPADVILLHVGTNNINNDDPNIVASDIARILDEIDRWERDNNTPVTVFLARIIDRSRPAGLFPPFPNPSVDALNNRLEQLAVTRRRDDIVVVDQHEALNYSCDDPRGPLCDMTLQRNGFIHPDQDGYNKMATRWLDSIIASGKVAKCE